ncbi:hypothetical protein BH09SUM1_BH09SUM1_34300 [soil metagenome]
MEIIRATAANAPLIVDILEDATEWLHSLGFVQWPPGFMRNNQRLIHARIEAGVSWIARVDGEAIGTLTLQWDDVEMWGEQPPVAGYVHSLSVLRTHKGHRYGEVMLAWASEQIAAAGRPLFRLDCGAENERLCCYYRDAGFHPVRIIKHPRGFYLQLFEKKVGSG